MIDAPVSGGVPRAKTGELAIMVGGDERRSTAREPVLQAMGTSDPSAAAASAPARR